MKRRNLLIMCVITLCLLSACGNKTAEEPVETEWSVYQMADVIWSVQKSSIPERHILSYDDPDFAPYLRDAYGIDPAQVADGAVIYAGGVEAQEIAVLRLTDESFVSGIEEALQSYIDTRAGAFAGYAPEQYAIVENSRTASRGAYAALLICPDPAEAEKAFADCFTAPPPEEAPLAEVPAGPEPEPLPDPEPEAEPEPVIEPDPVPAPEPDAEPDPASDPTPTPDPDPAAPTEPWSYDEARLVTAWTTGDRNNLPQEDLEILAILDEIPALKNDSLTVYQKELSLHDWMIAWAEYDPGALSSGPIGDPIPNNDNPYGFLTGKKGICTGYSSTFQLLMTLAGIECVTVPGTAHGGTDDHAWNLVKLNGDWYAVDTTWDDPVASFVIPNSMAHQYFNVTSDYLRQNDHQWDESAWPEATASAFAWAG